MDKDRSKVIAVFGASRRSEDSAWYREAYEVGAGLARAGYIVLNGGYAGSMAAVSRGAAEAGGRVIGITCSVFDPLVANAWVTEEEKAASLVDRLGAIMARSDGYIALRGGIGTLCEVTLAWSLIQTRTYAGKPLILLGNDWQRVLDTFRDHTDMADVPGVLNLARVVSTPAEAVAALAAPPPTPPGPPPLG